MQFKKRTKIKINCDRNKALTYYARLIDLIFLILFWKIWISPCPFYSYHDKNQMQKSELRTELILFVKARIIFPVQWLHSACPIQLFQIILFCLRSEWGRRTVSHGTIFLTWIWLKPILHFYKTIYFNLNLLWLWELSTFQVNFTWKKYTLNLGWKMNIFVKFWSHLTHFKTRTNLGRKRDRKLFSEDDWDFIGWIFVLNSKLSQSWQSFVSDLIEGPGWQCLLCTLAKETLQTGTNIYVFELDKNNFQISLQKKLFFFWNPFEENCSVFYSFKCDSK